MPDLRSWSQRHLHDCIGGEEHVSSKVLLPRSKFGSSTSSCTSLSGSLVWGTSWRGTSSGVLKGVLKGFLREVTDVYSFVTVKLGWWICLSCWWMENVLNVPSLGAREISVLIFLAWPLPSWFQLLGRFVPPRTFIPLARFVISMVEPACLYRGLGYPSSSSSSSSSSHPWCCNTAASVSTYSTDDNRFLWRLVLSGYLHIYMGAWIKTYLYHELGTTYIAHVVAISLDDFDILSVYRFSKIATNWLDITSALW